jgi:crossover junction endodeoxyribonuclease RusA
MALEFTVYGKAEPKGNMRAINLKGMKFPIVTETNRNVRSWSQLVAEGASQALGQLPDGARGVLQAGVRLTLAFYLPRPQKYHKRGVEPAHLVAPDLDKLARAVLDALTHIAYADDKQVVELVASKHYAAIDDAPHVRIRVDAIAGASPAPELRPRALEPSLPLGF